MVYIAPRTLLYILCFNSHPTFHSPLPIPTQVVFLEIILYHVWDKADK